MLTTEFFRATGRITNSRPRRVRLLCSSESGRFRIFALIGYPVLQRKCSPPCALPLYARRIRHENVLMGLRSAQPQIAKCTLSIVRPLATRSSRSKCVRFCPWSKYILKSTGRASCVQKNHSKWEAAYYPITCLCYFLSHFQRRKSYVQTQSSEIHLWTKSTEYWSQLRTMLPKSGSHTLPA